MRSHFVLSLVQAGIVTFGIFVVVSLSSVAFSQVMSSSNFSVQSDSVNFGGGLSSSGNFVLEATAGEVGTGELFSASYQLRAGYQQMQEVFLSLAVPAPLALLPALPGVTGGTASGSANIIVTTDSPAGYILSIAAVSDPAMQSPDNVIANYAPSGVSPDFLFVLNPTDAVFGFTPEGVDITTRYQDAGGVCGVAGADTPQRCWDGLSTSSKLVAQRATANHPVGSTTTLRFQVGLGGMIAVPAGQYVATTTISALPQ